MMTISVTKRGARGASAGPAEYFTGGVRLEPLCDAAEPGRAVCVSVSFEPGARTAWHTHPLGQTLIVTAGRGWVQEWGGEAAEIGEGDVVWIPAGVKHWHGAAADAGLTHISVAERQEGRTADWLEQVGEGEYPG